MTHPATAHTDGTLGEVFIQWGKQGTTGAGLMDIYAVALSVGLQHGVPLADMVASSLDLYFVPNGHTDDPDIPRVRSVADYTARRLAIDWLPYPQRAALGILTMDEKVHAARTWLHSQDSAGHSRVAGDGSWSVGQSRVVGAGKPGFGSGPGTRGPVFSRNRHGR